jgi:hypothetical protein
LQDFPGLLNGRDDVAEDFALALHEAKGWTVWGWRVGGGDDGDRFALVGDGDALVGLLYFEEECLEDFGEVCGGDGHGVLGDVWF